jgi:hypothetical protein
VRPFSSAASACLREDSLHRKLSRKLHPLSVQQGQVDTTQTSHDPAPMSIKIGVAQLLFKKKSSQDRTAGKNSECLERVKVCRATAPYDVSAG